MITIIINSDNNNDLDCSLANIVLFQKRICEKIHVIVNSHKNEDEVTANDIVEIYENDINVKVAYDEYNINQYEAFNNQINKINTPYVMFIKAGAKFAPGVINMACERLASKTDLNMVSLYQDNHSGEELVLAKKVKSKDISYTTVNLDKEPESIPMCLDTFIIKTSFVKGKKFKENLKYDAEKFFLYELLCDKPVFEYMSHVKGTALMVHNIALVSNIYANTFATDRCWYIDSIDNYLLQLIEHYNKKKGNVPRYIQYLVMYEIKWKFMQNWNNRNQHLYDENVDELVLATRRVLAYVDDSVIMNNHKAPLLNMSRIQVKMFLKVKLGEDYKPTFIKWMDKLIYCVRDNGIVQAATQNVIIDIIEYDKENFIIEGQFDSIINPEDFKLICMFNNEEVEVKEVYRYAHSKCFGVSVNKNYTFKVTYPISKLKGTKNVSFFIQVGDEQRVLKMRTRRYTAKLTTVVPHAYYIENGYCHQYVDNNTKMVITKVRRGTRLKKEIRFLGSVLLGSQSSERMFLMRLIYWITYPYYKNKNIWLSYDKLYKGGDCGEYIHRHILTRKDGVRSVYVINKDALDAKRLKKDKVKAYYFGTLSQKLNFLHASFILSTHSGTHTFNAITNQQIPYLMDLIKADNVCIQHGLTVQQLADVQGYVFNNTKRYYCASKYEIENLSKPIYGYEDKSILRLTGIPRFDGLVNDDRKQILITPTWRTYISMPSSMGQVRPYNPHFKETDYFKLYNNLLKDERLKKVAKETGYKLLYLIHPVITSQIDDYEQGEGIELLRADTCNYEELLTQSSLMLTDYSGVQFDFAYMRKPVVYYHPPKLPPHYKEGGFFYDTMGFGEICTEHEELVDVLCDYMRNNCEVKPEYRDREDDFFAYSDIKTCERIYDDLLEYQRQK